MASRVVLLSPVKTTDNQSMMPEEADRMHPQEMKLLETEKLRLHQDVVQLENKLRDVTAENEALRKGMHEILDSIHSQDGTVLISTDE
jgi:hypothetical protein